MLIHSRKFDDSINADKRRKQRERDDKISIGENNNSLVNKIKCLITTYSKGKGTFDRGKC